MLLPLRRLKSRLCIAIMLTLLAGFAVGLPTLPTVYAAGIVVTTTRDELNNDGDCSLREAITTINTNTAVDACDITTGSSTITLGAAIYTLGIANQLDANGQSIDEDANARGDLDIQRSVVIAGVGAATTIDGNQLDRVVETLPNTTVTIHDLMIRNGRNNVGGGILNNASALSLNNTEVVGNYGNEGAGIATLSGTTLLNKAFVHNNFGIGILNNALLTVKQSAISNNAGSGIVNRAASTADLTDTIISGNAGDYGGGVNNAGTLNIVGSTIRDNIANGFDEPSGGGINNATSGTIHLSTSELVNNTADYGGGIANGGGMTISNARIVDNKAKFGAGIFSRGSALNIDSTFVAGNTAIVGGAGIYTEHSLTLTNSTLYVNSAGAEGGGLLFATTDEASLTNSTISSNRSASSGGGIHNTSNGTLNLNNMTITGNVSNTDGDSFGTGGGISNPFGTVNIRNSIVASNADDSSEAGAPDCSGTLSSQGYNVIQSIAGCTIEGQTVGNILGQQPKIGPLENNGNNIPTHALLSDSPAIDAGSSATAGQDDTACNLTDQRGVTRPQDGNADGIEQCDIGAFELAPIPSPSPSPNPQPIFTRIFLPMVMEQVAQ